MCAAVSTVRTLLPRLVGILLKAQHSYAIQNARNAVTTYVIYNLEQGSMPKSGELRYVHTDNGYWVVWDETINTAFVSDEAPDLTGYTDVTSVVREQGFLHTQLFVPAS